jgi:hypothetical protein
MRERREARRGARLLTVQGARVSLDGVGAERPEATEGGGRSGVAVDAVSPVTWWEAENSGQASACRGSFR